MTRCFRISLLSVLCLWPVSHAAQGQSTAAALTKTAVTSRGLVGDLYMPVDAQGRLPAIIVLGGSRGGMDERAAWQADQLAAIDWLRGQHGIDADRIGIVGTSRR